MTDTVKAILTSALDFVTQREIPGNQGWEDKKFQALMEQTGWKQGEAWCAYFVELVLMTASLDQHANEISAGAVQTWANCRSSYLFKSAMIPAVGNIVIWQNYQNGLKQWTGHAGIIVAMGMGMIVTVEGNTNSEGGREGLEVALKVRNPQARPETGLRVLGFIEILVEE